jgi:hypothetical protein
MIGQFLDLALSRTLKRPEAYLMAQLRLPQLAKPILPRHVSVGYKYRIIGISARRRDKQVYLSVAPLAFLTPLASRSRLKSYLVE